MAHRSASQDPVPDGYERGPGGVGRRAVLSALVATALAGKTQAAPGPYEQVELAANALAEALERLHGGKWHVRISHTLGYVSVSRDFFS